MAVKTIETIAKIGAQDNTGTTFARVAAKLRGLESSAKSASLGVQAASRAEMIAAGASNKAAMAGAAALRVSGLSTLVTGAATALASGAAAGAMIKAGSERIHETLRMQSSGMSLKEIQEATLESARLAKAFPAIKQTELMHMLRNARSIVGSYEEAAGIMEPLAKLRIIAQANRPGQDVSEDFDQLVKGLEIKGVTQHPEEFKKYMEGIAKGLNMFGDTLKPYQYYEMFKYGRQATPALSEKFILSTAPTLAQELGGSSYGNAVSNFNAALIGGVMKNSAFKEFVNLGLINKDNVDFLKKTGEAKGFKPGADKHVEGWRLAQSDPNEWVKQYLIPALARKGITSQEDIMGMVPRLFQNQIAAQMVGILATQQSRINKDMRLWEGAKGLEAAKLYQGKDPELAWEGLKNSALGLGGLVGGQFAKDVTPGMNELSKALSTLTERLTILGNEKRPMPFLDRAKFVLGLDDGKPPTPEQKQDAVVRQELTRLGGAKEKAAAIRAWRASHDTDGFLGRFGAWRAGAADTDLSAAEADAARYSDLSAAHNEKRAAAANLSRFRNYVDSIRPFEQRVDNTTASVPSGLLAMPSGLGYGSTPSLMGVGAAGKGMALPGWIGGGKPDQSVRLEGSAEITNKVEVNAAPDFVVRVEQALQARGNLRTDVGVSLPPNN